MATNPTWQDFRARVYPDDPNGHFIFPLRLLHVGILVFIALGWLIPPAFPSLQIAYIATLACTIWLFWYFNNRCFISLLAWDMVQDKERLGGRPMCLLPFKNNGVLWIWLLLLLIAVNNYVNPSYSTFALLQGALNAINPL